MCSSRCRFRSRFGRGPVFALVAFGVMPSWSLSSAPASGAEAWKTSPACRRPWRAAAVVESSRSSFPNKFAVYGQADFCRSALVFLFSCHQGDGGEVGRSAAQWQSARWGRSDAVHFGSISSTALRRSVAVLPSTLMAERRLLRALACVADLRIFGLRHLITNLPADVPKGRPFGSRSVALFGGFVPSGVVPGDEVAGRDWKRRRELGGDGPDCFSVLCSRVMCAKGEDLVVFLFLLEVLYVKCNTTAQN